MNQNILSIFFIILLAFTVRGEDLLDGEPRSEEVAVEPATEEAAVEATTEEASVEPVTEEAVSSDNVKTTPEIEFKSNGFNRLSRRDRRRLSTGQAKLAVDEHGRIAIKTPEEAVEKEISEIETREPTNIFPEKVGNEVQFFDYKDQNSGNIQKLSNPDNPFVDAKELEKYVIGDGDLLKVFAWNIPEVSGLYRVGPDGYLTIPLVDSLYVRGFVQSEVKKKMTEKLVKFYPGVTVSVGVEEYNSNYVTVLGQVSVPGIIRLEKKAKLLDIVGRSGVKENANREFGYCTIMREGNGMAWVNLDGLIKQGMSSLNLDVRKNDFIYFYPPEEKRIFVMGQVRASGVYPWRPGMKVLEALSLAGGLTSDSEALKIKLIRPSKGEASHKSFYTIISPDQQGNIEVLPDDIIFVPANWMAKFANVFQRLNPLGWYFFTTGRATLPGAEPEVNQVLQ